MNKQLVLTTIKEHNNHISFIDLMNILRDQTHIDGVSTKYLITGLIGDGYLRGSTKSGGFLNLTPKGYVLLDELRNEEEKLRKEISDKKTKKKKDNIFALLIAVTGTLFGALVNFIIRLFS